MAGAGGNGTKYRVVAYKPLFTDDVAGRIYGTVVDGLEDKELYGEEYTELVLVERALSELSERT